jgi:hypothetical protein
MLQALDLFDGPKGLILPGSKEVLKAQHAVALPVVAHNTYSTIHLVLGEQLSEHGRGKASQAGLVYCSEHGFGTSAEEHKPWNLGLDVRQQMGRRGRRCSRGSQMWSSVSQHLGQVAQNMVYVFHTNPLGLGSGSIFGGRLCDRGRVQAV